MLTQLIHCGVVIPEPPPVLGLTLTIQGELRTLTPKQEEMALAWAKKQGTPYVQDRVFAANFLADFSQELGRDAALSLDQVDFGPALRVVEAERAAKEALTIEERKALAAERKAKREELRERFGHAIANGERVELANYIVEPSGLFMGRGQHPLRGRWKEGAHYEDVTLNLSPDAPVPEGPWGEIVWQPDSLWVARWKDNLSGKLKYVWLSDTAPIKQAREARKFDKAHKLHDRLELVRGRIQEDLVDEDPKQRMIATACYLIDGLCLRVGDEKDPDEADTVGATTLRPEHVTLHDDGSAEFRFLGKDSVLWHKTIDLPPVVQANLQELIDHARPSNASKNGGRGHPTRDKPQLFPDISSRDVNTYLSGIQSGLTAKVFRTHHATMAVRSSLDDSGVKAGDPEHAKWEAANLANLEAAMLCNHTKQAPANWASSRQRYKERQQQAEERVVNSRQKADDLRQTLADLRKESKSKTDEASEANKPKIRARYRKRIELAKGRLEAAREQLDRARNARDKLKAQASIASKKRTWNLGTSLKSYIDPRIYYDWGQRVEYDVLQKYYPATLQRKFAWIKADSEAETPESSSQDGE